MSDLPPGLDPASPQRRARFDDLYARLHGDLWRYCLRRVWPTEDAEDLMADVLAVVWRRLDEVPEAPGDRPYVFAIARNHVRDRRRTAARRDRIFQLAAAREERDTRTAQHALAPGSHLDAAADESDAAQLDALREAFAQLSEPDAEVLRLAAWDELSHREIATVLGCRENAVAVRLHRARRRLRRHLAQQLGVQQPEAQPPDEPQPAPTSATPRRTTGDDAPVRSPQSLDHASGSSGGTR